MGKNASDSDLLNPAIKFASSCEQMKSCRSLEEVRWPMMQKMRAVVAVAFGCAPVG